MSVKPLEKLPEDPLPVRRALLSVSKKINIISLAKVLHKAEVEIISTGGTARKIRKVDIPVTDVSQLTGHPEYLDGRVKTLHPAIHAGILARTSHQADVDELKRININPIELVVANLYPFKQTIEHNDCTPALATENIDIGGPTLIRAAAKNFAHVTVLTHPDQYDEFIAHFEEDGWIDFAHRQAWARQAFNHIAEYDSCIANYFNGLIREKNPYQLNIALPKSQELRYGENPHQQAAAYGNQQQFIDCFHGKQLSYNNFMDIDAALNLIADFDDEPACAIFKHTVPCGVATATNLKTAWDNAFATDTSSPFGGIVVVNKELTLTTAKAIDQIFTEIILAPSFTREALDLLQQKKKRRLIRIKEQNENTRPLRFRSIFGGALCQQPDCRTLALNDCKIVSKREPAEQEMLDLLFAWKVVKHLKSNGIVYARGGQTIGLGTGQTSRIESSEIAVAKAEQEGLNLSKSVIGSDAFFPFADGVQAAAQAGATAVIQPGGSIRDEEVIAAADEQGMAMVFTGYRHFRH